MRLGFNSSHYNSKLLISNKWSALLVLSFYRLFGKIINTFIFHKLPLQFKRSSSGKTKNLFLLIRTITVQSFLVKLCKVNAKTKLFQIIYLHFKTCNDGLTLHIGCSRLLQKYCNSFSHKIEIYLWLVFQIKINK